jgi:hypothetical protein
MYNKNYDDNRGCNNGFWDRDADERAERMRTASERGGVENFFDLSPEERAEAYDNDE